MTNNELVTIMTTAQISSENIFDIYEKLSDYQEEYSKMPIAKIKPTIYDAYELYVKSTPAWEKIINTILNADYTKIIEQFDLNKMIEQIPEEYRSFFGDLISEQNK